MYFNHDVAYVYACEAFTIACRHSSTCLQIHGVIDILLNIITTDVSSFSVLTLSVGCHEGHSACKKISHGRTD